MGTNREIPVVAGFRCTGKHYTDDGEMTACAGYHLSWLPSLEGEELVDNPDELTCPGCKATFALAVKVTSLQIHGHINET